MTNVWGMLFAVLEFSSALVLFDTFMERKNKNPVVAILFILSGIAVYKFIISQELFNRYFFIVLIPGYFFIATFIIYNARLLQRAFASIFIVALFYTIDSFIIIGIDFLQIELSRNILGIFSKLLLLFALLLVKILLRNKISTLNIALGEWAILLLLPTIIMYFYGLTFYRKYDLGSGNFSANSYSIISLAIMSCMLLFQTYVFLKSKQKNKLEQKNRRLEQQIKLQMESVLALTNFNHSQRKLTHEYKNQLICISELIKKQKYDEACRFIKTSVQFLNESTLIIRSNVPVIDAIISQKYFTAKSKNIEMEFLIDDLSKLPISEVEMVTILANLLDNAIAACEKSVEKMIRVKLKQEQKAGDFLIAISNTVSKPVEIIDNQILTTQKDLQLHGFGLENIREVLERHHGIFAITCNGGWFCFSGTIPYDLPPIQGG